MANNKDFLLKNAIEVGGSTKVTLGTITSGTVDLSTGNYFAETLAANTTYTFSNAGDVQAFQMEVTGGVTYDPTSYTIDGTSFSTASQETNCTGVAIGDSGTKAYVVGTTNDTIYQYTLSSPYTTSGGTYASKSLSVSSQDTAPQDLYLKPDGTKVYIAGNANKTVYQYDLSTAWDISTGSYSSKSFSVSSQLSSQLSGLAFSADGTKMYACGSLTGLFQYTLSTPWDVSTASYSGVSFNYSANTGDAVSVAFTPDGKWLLLANTSGAEDIDFYSLSIAWNISTATYDSTTSNLDTTYQNSLSGISVSDDGSALFFTGQSQDEVDHIDLTVGSLSITWPASVEWTANTAPASPSSGQTNLYTFLTDDGGTSYIGLLTAEGLS